MPRGRSESAVLDAMRSGEWLRSQWIARVAGGLGDAPWRPQMGISTLRILKRLEQRGAVEHRAASEDRAGTVGGHDIEFSIPRTEWRLR